MGTGSGPGPGFHASKDGSGYVYTNTQAKCTHDTFRVNENGDVSDLHSSASAKGEKSLSGYHQG